MQIESFEREDAFDEPAVRLLSTIAASMGVALQNARLFDQTQRNARESSALSEVGRDLSSTLDLATVMDRIAGHAKGLLAAENSAIFLPDTDGKTYRALVALGDLADALKAAVVEPGVGIIGSLIESGRAEFINDSAADPRALQLAGTERGADERLMVVPLKSGDEVQGAMVVWRSGGKPFDSAGAGIPGRPVAAGRDRAATTRACSTRPRPRCNARPPAPTSCASSASRPTT